MNEYVSVVIMLFLAAATAAGMIVAASIEEGQPVVAGFHEDIPVGARLK